MTLKAIIIDPMEMRVVAENLEPTPGEIRRLCGAPAHVIATLPNGDVLLAAEGEQSEPGFSIGGSKAVRSPAIVLGRRGAAFKGRTAGKVERRDGAKPGSLG